MIRPIGNAVVVKILGILKRTKGNIIIPDFKYEHPERVAKVIRVGKGKLTKKGKRIPVAVKPGDIVLITGYCGVGEKGGEGKYATGDEIVITEDDIIGVFEEMPEVEEISNEY